MRRRNGQIAAQSTGIASRINMAWTSGIHVSLVIMVFRVSVRGKMPLTWDNVDCRDLHEPQEGTPFR
jgi:hypothetical protein